MTMHTPPVLHLRGTNAALLHGFLQSLLLQLRAEVLEAGLLLLAGVTGLS